MIITAPKPWSGKKRWQKSRAKLAASYLYHPMGPGHALKSANKSYHGETEREQIKPTE